MSTNPNDAAFARPWSKTSAGNRYFDGQQGLTKREEFAKAAMQGFCADRSLLELDADILSKWAIQQADSLIAALNKTAKEE